MEIECRKTVGKPSALIQVPHGRQRSDLICLRRSSRAQSPSILYWYTQPFHKGARIQTEALLPRNQGVAVVHIFHLAFAGSLDTPTS